MRKKDTKRKLQLNTETLRGLELTAVTGGQCTKVASGCNPDYSFVYTGCPGHPC